MKKKTANKDRFLIRALRSIAAIKGIEFSSFSHNWIVQLRRNEVTRFVYGYNFDLNSVAAASIADDKCALSAVLKSCAIAHVEHTLFLAPRLSEYIGTAGNWQRAMEYAEHAGYPLVCKANQGTGGNAVFKVSTQTELEAAFQKIHTSGRGLALSCYYPIDAEYRIIILQGATVLCYEKQRPFVIGDGHSTFFELLQSRYSQDSELLEVALVEPSFPLNEIPPRGCSLPIIWKHNLGKGATPLFSLDPTVKQAASELAQSACAAIGMQFASIDVIQTGNQMKIMEVNAGIMLENVSCISNEAYELAFDVYSRAVDVMFDLAR